MTFSLIARCPESHQFGIGATTAVPAVGALLTHAVAGVGAIATQAKLNPYIGIDGIRLLKNGRTADEVMGILRDSDPCAKDRQFAVIDRAGKTAAFTGSDCLRWAGHQSHEGYSVQGNRLTGEAVIERVAKCFEHSAGKPLAERLMEALEAGNSVGGDRDGELSATIYIVDKEEYPLWDIRVDSHPDPFAELRRLHDIFAKRLIPAIRRMPTRENPAGAPEQEHA